MKIHLRLRSSPPGVDVDILSEKMRGQPETVGSLAIMFVDSLDITLDVFLAYESEVQVRAMLLGVHNHISREENDELQLSTANEALLLKGYRIIQHLTAVLAHVKLDEGWSWATLRLSILLG